MICYSARISNVPSISVDLCNVLGLQINVIVISCIDFIVLYCIVSYFLYSMLIFQKFNESLCDRALDERNQFKTFLADSV